MTRSSASNALSAISVSACIEGRRWSAPTRSCASPPVRKKLTGLPSASTRRGFWCSTPRVIGRSPGPRRLFLGAGAVLMGTHNGAVDHRIFIVGVSGKMQEDLLPYTRFRPSAEALMHVLPVTEALRQIAPRHAGAVAV